MHKRVRTCLAKMRPSRPATVSTVKRAFSHFETEGKGPFVWGDGMEPLWLLEVRNPKPGRSRQRQCCRKSKEYAPFPLKYLPRVPTFPSGWGAVTLMLAREKQGRTNIFFSQHLCSPGDLIPWWNNEGNHACAIAPCLSKTLDELLNLFVQITVS